LHFYDVTLTSKKPQSATYPKSLKTIGDHLRKRRIDLRLYQKDVAKAIGVDTLTICNWENNLTSPRLYLLPKINSFPGTIRYKATQPVLEKRSNSIEFRRD
jgi:transcriptional regulator with XRE-family HTH domain